MDNIDIILRIMALIPPFFTLFITLTRRKDDKSSPLEPPIASQTVKIQNSKHSTVNIKQNQAVNSYNQTITNHYHAPSSMPSSSSKSNAVIVALLLFFITILGLTYTYFKDTIIIITASLLITILISSLGKCSTKKTIRLFLYFSISIIALIICKYDYFVANGYAEYFQNLSTATHGQFWILLKNMNFTLYMWAQIISLALISVPVIIDLMNNFKNFRNKEPKKSLKTDYFNIPIVGILIICILYYFLIYYWKIF